MPDSGPMLYVATYGPGDPTRATLVFAAAIQMAIKPKTPNVPVQVALLGEGIRLLQDDITLTPPRVIGGQTYTSIKAIMARAIAEKVEIHC